MDSGISNLLHRAELCFERGQTKVARLALETAVERLGGDSNISNWPEFVYRRIIKLDEMLKQASDLQSNSKPQEKKRQLKCGKCKGKGLLRVGTLCFACQGKGYLTEQDIETNRRYHTAMDGIKKARLAENCTEKAE